MVLTDDLVCPRCGLAQRLWKGQNGNGYLRTSRNGELRLYCCSGCALNRCTCRTPSGRAGSESWLPSPGEEENAIALR